MKGLNTAQNPDEAPNDLQLAKQITNTCYQMYRQSPTGLNAHNTLSLNGRQAAAQRPFQYYDQQPELVESLMYLWRLTHDQTYRDWGWQIFRATQMWTR